MLLIYFDYLVFIHQSLLFIIYISLNYIFSTTINVNELSFFPLYIFWIR